MTKQEERRLDKQIKQHQREQKNMFAEEQRIIQFMKKTGVEYHHHSKKDLIDMKPILKELNRQKPIFKTADGPTDYWATFHGRGLALLDCNWSSSEFETIYDVPLDGTYIFQIYDSGHRGYGSKNNITAIETGRQPYVPYVNPGAIIPITAN
jgi:hypothetical protein